MRGEWGFVFAAALVITVGCRDRYFEDWPPSYRFATTLVGERPGSFGARSAALAGAGRAGEDGPVAVVVNPSALARGDRVALTAGAGLRYRALTVQSAPGETRAQSFAAGWAESTGAAAAAPLPGGRVGVGAAVWRYRDFSYEMGEEGGDRIFCRGGLEAATAGMACRAGGASLGVASDYLWGGEDLTSTESAVPTASRSGRGYDVRGAAGYEFRVGGKWAVRPAIIGARGGKVRWRGGGEDFEVRYPGEIGGAVTIARRRLAVHADYTYFLYGVVGASTPARERTLRAAGRSVGWPAVGVELRTAGTTVVRGGAAYRPSLFSNAAGRRVDGWTYGLGAGWPVWKGQGRWDVALTYGRRGALETDGYVTDTTTAEINVHYFW